MKTVRVRILVAVDADSNWDAQGSSSATKDAVSVWLSETDAYAGLNSTLHWVEADVPVPTFLPSETPIQADKVTPA